MAPAMVGGAALGPAWRPPTAPASGDHGPEWAGGRPQLAWQGLERAGSAPRPRVLALSWCGKIPCAASFLGTGTKLGKAKSWCGDQDPSLPGRVQRT